jgi:uncharacterized membrane protein
MLRNEDFYGNKIRNEDDPLVRQAIDLAKYVARTPLPLSVRQYAELRKTGESKAKAVQGFFGITPAPAWTRHTPAEELAMDLEGRNYTPGARTREQQAIRERRQRVLVAYGHKEQPGAADAKAWRDSDRKWLNDHLGKGTLERVFRTLTLSQAIRVYQVASATEKARLAPLLQQKAGNRQDAGELTEEEWAALAKLG